MLNKAQFRIETDRTPLRFKQRKNDHPKIVIHEEADREIINYLKASSISTLIRYDEISFLVKEDRLISISHVLRQRGMSEIS
jgi:hypothetical protein